MDEDRFIHRFTRMSADHRTLAYESARIIFIVYPFVALHVILSFAWIHGQFPTYSFADLRGKNSYRLVLVHA